MAALAAVGDPLMWSPGNAPPPIEKFTKPRWSAENTAKTQQACNALWKARIGLEAVTGESDITRAMDAALRRFKQLDPNVILMASISEW